MSLEPIELEIAAYSDVGLVRENNEDIAVVGRTFVRDGNYSTVECVKQNGTLVLGVADGVGGSNAGEIASRFVIEWLTNCINTLDSGADGDAIEETVRDASVEAHETLIRRGLLHPRYAGMATTATVLFLHHGAWYLVHAGDSRFYLGSENGLRRLTRDHTLREFSGDPRIPGNILINCFGSQDEFFIDFFRVFETLTDRDVLLICSDGLTDMVDEAVIWDVLSSQDEITVVGQRLVELAKAGGGRDNITFVAARALRSECADRVS